MQDAPGPTVDRATIHALSNHLAVILGFAELLLAESSPDDPRHADLLEIRRAAVDAAALLAPLRGLSHDQESES